MKLRSLIPALALFGLVGCGGGGVNTDFTRNLSDVITTQSYQDSLGFYYNVHAFFADRTGNSTFVMSSPDFDPFLIMEDENHNEIARDDNSGAGDDALINPRLTRDHIYYLIATTAISNRTGRYDILYHGDQVTYDGTRGLTAHPQNLNVKPVPEN